MLFEAPLVYSTMPGIAKAFLFSNKSSSIYSMTYFVLVRAWLAIPVLVPCYYGVGTGWFKMPGLSMSIVQGNGLLLVWCIALGMVKQ